MDEDKELVTIARFEDELEAHMLRNELNNQGIPAMVAGNNATGFGLDGISASVQVNVRKIDEELAKEFIKQLAEEEANAPTIEEWKCPCGETVDEGFYVCWSCGFDYEDLNQDGGLEQADGESS